MVIIDRTSVLDGFNFKYTGTDDLILWLATVDYSNGIFHEPFFYRQNYNVMLEALMAAPLYKFGLPLKYALPISTSFLTLFPFFLYSIVLFKRKFFSISLLVVMIPLALPVEYGVMTSMSRGFVQGLFFCSFFIFPLLSPLNSKLWLMSALSSGLALVCNPNSIIVIVPVLLFLFLKNFKSVRFYIIHIFFMGLILGLGQLAKYFYELNPEFNIHPLASLEFSWNQFLNNYQNPSKFFSFYTPFYWYQGWLVIPLMFVLALFLFKQNKITSLSLGLSILFVISSLGINKVNDSADELLLASSRMYLGLPIITAISCIWMKDLINFKNKNWILIIFVIALITFIIKQNRMVDDLKFNRRNLNVGPVAIQKISELEEQCLKIKMAADTNEVDFILFIPNWMINTAQMQIYNCGCPLLIEDMPQTQLIMYERRTWVYLQERKNVRKNILMYGLDPTENRHKDFSNAIVIARFPDMTLFRKNTLQLDTLLKRLGY